MQRYKSEPYKKGGIKTIGFGVEKCCFIVILGWYDQLRCNKIKDNAPLCEVKVVRSAQSRNISTTDGIAIELNIMGKVDARLYLKERQIRDLLKELMNAATVVR